MPVSGKLVLKGGQSLGVTKKKKKKKPRAEEEGAGAEDQAGNKPTEAADPSEPAAQQKMGKAGDLYEKEFNFETSRAAAGKTRNTPWGQGYRAPPSVLHGYQAPVKGDTHEERLDLRCAKKADKHCK